MKSQASEALNPERLQSQNRLRQKFESPIKPLGVLHGRLGMMTRYDYDAPMATEPDYYIATIDTGAGPFPWRWELRRHSRPMSVRIGAGRYQTQAAAEFGGKGELESFLVSLANEERRTR